VHGPWQHIIVSFGYVDGPPKWILFGEIVLIELNSTVNVNQISSSACALGLGNGSSHKVASVSS